MTELQNRIKYVIYIQRLYPINHIKFGSCMSTDAIKIDSVLLYQTQLMLQRIHNSFGPQICVDNSSQTTRPIGSSVQSLKYVKISSQQSSSALRYQMRDLYNRRIRLADWIKRVNDDVDEEP